MSTPGPAPGFFTYPESRTGKGAVGLIATLALCGILASIAAAIATACVVEHERSALVGLAFLLGLVLTHVSINGLQAMPVLQKEVST